MASPLKTIASHNGSSGGGSNKESKGINKMRASVLKLSMVRGMGQN
jgi:hypothetical protein